MIINMDYNHSIQAIDHNHSVPSIVTVIVHQSLHASAQSHGAVQLNVIIDET